MIDDNRVVAFHYRLSDGFGALIDSSSGGLPLVYMHNTNALLPSLERELTGHRVGDALQITIYPEDAYGYADESLVQRVSRERLGQVDDLAVGMRVRAIDCERRARLMTVTALDEETIELDANHPLAGRVLHFEIVIVAVREPTATELARGAATTANAPD